MNCVRCSKKISDDSKFCNYCGRQVRKYVKHTYQMVMPVEDFRKVVQEIADRDKYIPRHLNHKGA